jgi:hypothetical protein
LKILKLDSLFTLCINFSALGCKDFIYECKIFIILVTMAFSDKTVAIF